MLRMLAALFIALSLLSCSSFSRKERTPVQYSGPGTVLPYTSAQLQLKNLDEMVHLVRIRTRRAQSRTEDGLGSLRQALRIIYARPNEDFLTEKLIGDVRFPLEELEEWQSSIEDLAYEASAQLYKPESLKPAVQLTYIIILENLLADLRPAIAEPWIRTLVERIRDAEMTVTDAARSERELKMMKSVANPADIAARIIPYPEE